MRIKKMLALLLSMVFLLGTVGTAFADEVENPPESVERLVIDTTTIGTARVGIEFVGWVSASGGTGNYTFTIEGLPEDFNYDATSGRVFGTPTVAGVYSYITVRVEDSAGTVVEKSNISLLVMNRRVNFRATNNVYDWEPDTQFKAKVEPAPGEPQLVEGVDYEVTYEGQPYQTRAGSYQIKVKMIGEAAKGYTAGSVTPSTLMIRPAGDAFLYLTSKSVEYGQAYTFAYGDGYTTSPENLDCLVQYQGTGSTNYPLSEVPPTEIGTYSVIVTLMEQNYPFQQRRTSLVITPPTKHVTVTDFEHTWDAATGSWHADVSCEDGIPLSVTYTNVDTEQYPAEVDMTEVTGAGTYDINVTATDGSAYNFVLDHPQLIVHPKTVDFTVDNATQDLTGSGPWKADISAAAADAPTYTVTYTSSTGVVYENAVSDPREGNYTIGIRLDSTRNYTVGTLTTDTFVLNDPTGAVTVDFYAPEWSTENDHLSYNGKDQTWNVVPQLSEIPEDLEYQVTYTKLSGEGSALESVKDVGEYKINVEITGGNYKVGTITPSQFRMEAGNITVKVGDLSQPYTGWERPVSVTWEPADADFAYHAVYKQEGAEVRPIAVGTYDVEIVPEAADSWNITVDPTNPTLEIVEDSSLTEVDFALTDAGVYTYTGQAHEPQVEPVAVEGNNYADLDYTVTYGKVSAGVDEGLAGVTDAGEYKAFIKINTPGYRLGTNAQNITVTVHPATVTVDFPTLSYEYDGNPKEAIPVVTPPEASVSVQYTVEGAQTTTAPSEVGTYPITVQSANPNYRIDTVTPDNPALEITAPKQGIDFIASGFDETPNIVVSDGSTPKTVTVAPDMTDVPADLTYDFTYDKVDTAEVETLTSIQDAGEYAINVNITGGNYRVQSVTPNTVVLRDTNKTSVDFTITNSLSYTGDPQTLTITSDHADTLSEGTDYTITYGHASAGASEGLTEVTDAGAYVVYITMLNPAYQVGSIQPSNQFEVAPAHAKAFVTDMRQTYDGTPKNVTVRTEPSIATKLQYVKAGDTAVITDPTEIGVYNVTVVSDDKNYVIDTADVTPQSAKLKIADPAVTNVVDFIVTNSTLQYTGSAQTLTLEQSGITETLTAGVDYTVTYSHASASTPEGLTGVTEVGDYVVSIEMINPDYQLGDILPTTAFSVTPAYVTVSLGNLTQEHDGTKKDVSVTTEPLNVAHTISYTDSTGMPIAEPTEIGEYNVSVSIDDPNYVLYEVQPENPVLKITPPPESVDFAVTNVPTTYTGQAQAATVSPVGSYADLTYEVKFADADGASHESCLDAGTYQVEITITGGDYRVGTIDVPSFTIQPADITVTVADMDKTYDGTVKNDITVTWEPADLVFAHHVVYKQNGAEITPINIGTYDIEIVPDKASNWNTITVNPTEPKLSIQGSGTPLEFTIENVTKQYDPDNAQTATVTLTSADTVDYTVIYDNLKTADAEEDQAVQNVGSYQIIIRVPEGYYPVITGSTVFTITPKEFTFAIGAASKPANGKTYSAADLAITEPDGITQDDYTVAFELADGTTVSTVKEAGRYPIVITMNDANYVGIAQPDTFEIYTFSLFKNGNSPVGLIMRDSWDEQKKAEAIQSLKDNHQFIDPYVPEGGNAEVKYPEIPNQQIDFDETAVYVRNLADFAGIAPKQFSARYENGSEVAWEDVTVTVKNVLRLENAGLDGLIAAVAGTPSDMSLADIQNIYAVPSVYDVEYTYLDSDGETMVTGTQKLVVAGRVGDINLDGDVNRADAKLLENRLDDIKAAIADTNGIYLYRICDVNMDGIVDSQDAAMIANRMRVPVRNYYNYTILAQ